MISKGKFPFELRRTHHIVTLDKTTSNPCEVTRVWKLRGLRTYFIHLNHDGEWSIACVPPEKEKPKSQPETLGEDVEEGQGT